MENSVAIFAVVNFAVIGISHIIQRRAWVEFFKMLAEKGPVGALMNGFLSLAMGSFIVAFHNVWSGVPIILTLLGWAYVGKALAVFVFPDWNVRSMKSVESSGDKKFILAGSVMLIVAAILSADLMSNAW